MRVNDIPRIEELSVAEKILLVEDLWDSIVAAKESVPIPASHMEELGRRLEKANSDPGRLLSLEELKQRIEKRK